MGLRVLVVEDEMTIALMIEDMLADLGHRVVDMPMRLPLALAATERGGFDLAILDVNLDGETSYPVATLLQERGVPFVFATGYGASGLAPEFRDRPVLQKPFLRDELERALATALRDR